MNAYTYYEPVTELNPTAQCKLLDLWKQSWSKNGWTPIVLCKTHAMEHPSFKQYEEAVNALPTVNPKEYEMSCYLRWLAMAQMGGGLMCDYDVVNLHFTPDQAPALSDAITVLDRCAPCVVSGNQRAYLAATRIFATYTLEDSDIYDTRKHISDMYILHKPVADAITIWSSICKEYMDDGWIFSPLVHCATMRCGDMAKDTLVSALVNGKRIEASQD